MINLLPFQYKKELWQIEKQKIIAILGSVLLLSLFCLTLILFSVEIFTEGQVTVQRIFASVWEREFRQTEIQELQKKVKLANQTLAKLSSFYEAGFSFADAAKEIIQTLPEGISLYSLSFGSLTEQGPPEGKQAPYGAGVEVSLSGFAESREILFKFKNNLEMTPNFKDIYFPASNWVKPTDIDFFVSFKAL